MEAWPPFGRPGGQRETPLPNFGQNQETARPGTLVLSATNDSFTIMVRIDRTVSVTSFRDLSSAAAFARVSAPENLGSYKISQMMGVAQTIANRLRGRTVLGFDVQNAPAIEAR